MELVSNIFTYFLLAVSVGLGVFPIMVNARHTGAGFIKLVNNINIAALMLLLLGGTFSEIIVPVALAITMLAIGPLFQEDKMKKFYPLIYLVQNSAIFYLFFYFNQFQLTESVYYLLSGMAFLGIITYAMILGHWYLVVPGLSENHLKKALIAFWAILALKIVLMTNEVLNHPTLFEGGTQEAMGYMFNWIILLMRFGWGYLIIAIMGLYTWRLTKMRSIQSATGILYVMTFFVFIGELIAGYYHFKYGINL